MDEESAKAAADLLWGILKVRLSRGLATSAIEFSDLLESINSGSIRLFTSSHGEPIGYVAWAKVSRETLNLIVKTGEMPRYPYERRDGKLIVFFDVVFDGGWSVLARYEFLKFLRKKRIFFYYKNNRLISLINKYERFRGQFWKYKRLPVNSLKFIKHI